MAKENDLISKYSRKTRQYNPNVIHNLGMCDVIINDDSIAQYTDKSVTDKESYRITLANMRSFMSNPKGSLSTGQYSIPAGKDYDPNFDFSYLNRKDLTIVDVQNFINNYRQNLENYDEDMRLKIEEQLEKADQILKDKELQAKDTINNSSSAE